MQRVHVQVGYDSPTNAPQDEDPITFSSVAVLPEAGDNVAIARKEIAPNTRIAFNKQILVVDDVVLEGHRFAVSRIEAGERLLSWGLPFGVACSTILPGQYVINDRMIYSLKFRSSVHHSERRSPNFTDLIVDFSIPKDDEQATANNNNNTEKNHVRVCDQVPLDPHHDGFMFAGFARGGGRGVGTRNFVVVIPTTVHASPFAKQLVRAFRDVSSFPNVDGVVAVGHTEGGQFAGQSPPHNLNLLTRTLAGFAVHPNVGAVLLLDYGFEVLQAKHVINFATREYTAKFSACNIKNLVLSGDDKSDHNTAKSIISELLESSNSTSRSLQAVKHITIALQCGGSDAFSGVSGNPAAGTAAKILIERGGAAVLAETDELIGAEPYVLERVRSMEVGHKFLSQIARFKERMMWHGQSAESNPSAGNALRGLYNIALKSIGAAKKKHAQVRLDDVIEYGEPIPQERGYYFMDSPGNDLESIAGQVASGCNVIIFITGNGSITNFPFVPTIKVITTTSRHQLVGGEMDFNAGRFQDMGTPLTILGAELLDHVVRVCGGEQSKGELAGHSQVSIWRDWPQTGPVPSPQMPSPLTTAATTTETTATTQPQQQTPIQPTTPFAAKNAAGDFVWRGILSSQTHLPQKGDLHQTAATGAVALILPSSLCSAEVSVMIAEGLNTWLQNEGSCYQHTVSRFVALAHTEGCGVGYSQGGEDMYSRVMLGHLFHPNVRLALLLEHGCEKSHNSWWRTKIAEVTGTQEEMVGKKLGWASIQLDGGIHAATAKVESYFRAQMGQLGEIVQKEFSVGDLVVGIAAQPNSSPSTISLAASFVQTITQFGGRVILPANNGTTQTDASDNSLLLECQTVHTPITFAERITTQGGECFAMHTPLFCCGAELTTGFVAAGATVVVVFGGSDTPQACGVTLGHPLVPVIHIHNSNATSSSSNTCTFADLQIAHHTPQHQQNVVDVVQTVLGVVSGKLVPNAANRCTFQITRGNNGVSA